jgi:hypothetical protein
MLAVLNDTSVATVMLSNRWRTIMFGMHDFRPSNEPGEAGVWRCYGCGAKMGERIGDLHPKCSDVTMARILPVRPEDDPEPGDGAS